MLHGARAPRFMHKSKPNLVDATVAVFFGTRVNIVGFSLSLTASVSIGAAVAVTVTRGAQPHGASPAATREERRRSIQGRGGARARFMPHGGTRRPAREGFSCSRAARHPSPPPYLSSGRQCSGCWILLICRQTAPEAAAI